ncbi:transcriptional regulator [Streptomyces sp. NPDC047046]|uniref:transcriptional regulator n=1 Tax=Streptomyces sp. NPDC047046 TaxID=3155378 RepID=UPI0033F2E8C8
MGRPPAFYHQHPLTFVRTQLLGFDTLKGFVEWLATEINGAAAAPVKAWRWENYGVQPERLVQEVLARKLDVPLRRLTSHPWPEWLPIGKRIPVGAHWNLEGTLQVLDAAAVSEVDRRGFLTLGAGATAALAHGWAAADNPAWPGTKVPLSEADLVESMERRLPLLRQLEDRRGGAAAELLNTELHSARLSLNMVRGAGAQRSLLSVIATMARIAGWAHVDIGAVASAERLFVVGLRAAHAVGDHSAGANLLKCISLLLIDHGRAKEAAEVAEVAVRRTQSSSPRVRAMLLVREARTRAAVGDARAAGVLLRRADDLMDRADGEPAPDWALYFDSAEHSAQVAACHLALNEVRQADAILDEALRNQPAERARDAVTYGMWQAEAAVRQGEVERSCALVGNLLPRVYESSSARNAGRLKKVRGLLAERGKDAVCVRELDERIRAFSGGNSRGRLDERGRSLVA